MNAIIKRHTRSQEYLSICRDMARRGLQGNTGDALPELISGRVLTEINENLPRFRMFVSMFHKDIWGY